MKPSPFEYHDPHEVGEALALLSEHGDDAKVLAGGQSLVPLLNFRLASPARLVDINRVAGLSYLRRSDGHLSIGALTRHAVAEQSPLVSAHWPLLTQALGFVAHAQIRNRGTVGGSAAHADPAAELPVAFAALEARFSVASVRGERTIPWRQFFVTHLTTSLEPDELLTGVELPPLPPRTGSAFTEYARRHGDYALGGAAVLVTLDQSGNCERAAVALLGAADVPIRAEGAERLLQGARVDDELAVEAAAAAVAELEPTGDIHGSSQYRRRLIQAMVRRGVIQAAARAAA